MIIDNKTLINKNFNGSTSFSGKFHKIIIYYSNTQQVNTTIQITGDSPYLIDITFKIIVMEILISLLILYIISSCIMCCTEKGLMDQKLIYEYETKIWENYADLRKKNILNKYPEAKYNEILNKFNQLNCSICLGELSCEKLLIRKLICGHIFHSECIESWVQSKIKEIPTCPICHTKLTILKPPNEIRQVIDFSIEMENPQQSDN